MGFFDRIGAKHEVATLSFNLGNAYKDIPSLRNLDEAEKWYRRGLDLHDKADNLGRAKCVCQLGLVAHERFQEGRKAKRPKEELLRHINDAAGYYLQSLDLTPSDAVDDLAVAHNQLGAIYADAGNLDRALHHWREAIRYFEAASNKYHAAVTRGNVGLALAQAGRFPDAMEYARAALRGFESFGQRAAAEIEKTQGLIAMIEQLATAKEKESGGGS
jgi:tetratricopeptide (TPR) repeat protein